MAAKQAQPAGLTVRVAMARSNLSFAAARDRPVLEAGLAASMNLPRGCKTGNCGACRVRLLEGRIRYPHGRPAGLGEREIADGFVLLCQAHADSDLILEVPGFRRADETAVKRLPCRIERAEAVAHDVMQLGLRLPAVEPFRFQPGQYIDVLLPRGRRRSFSIASPPHDSPLLELHVRRVAGGEFSEPLFEADPRGGLLTIEGPLGNFVYRHGAAPLLLIGGGTGIAPLISILRHVIENGIERDITLYWGVRGEADLYAMPALRRLQARTFFRCVPVLSEPGVEWVGERGWVHAAALRDSALASCEIYAAGPPAMIVAVQVECAARQVPADRLQLDSFDYA
jgi:CDP-4-dehydro-6-deoxyglucose reductase